MIHVVAALCRRPFGIIFQQLDIKPIQAARSANIEGVLADLADGADAGQWQEETKIVRKIRVRAGDGLAAHQVFCLEIHAVRGKDEFRLGSGRRWAVFERFERLRDLPGIAGQYMDVAGLEHTAKVGFVGRTAAQALDRCRLVPECFKEGIREIRRVKWLLRQVRDGLFNFYGVQRVSPFSHNRYGTFHPRPHS